ncbi:hypothetical protein M406DRAFT_287023 [Cryphonectria parasitica EP155]|uniref:Carbohydrate kinase PfkB domain-containing protein n=1 Tax=Cryphonectria parasitica (strain ATCC 38755 / EP155) TaxID=660469 RepID=A0A9P5CTA9_CRYP1|nr:uncharacterized protein M406DRAFT_287023 [Cryphonectria parasitica EP155]KAF3768965.1 hypothetical protein M406DRAFT_287023 [Cryphonectria parasitica EP155]
MALFCRATRHVRRWPAHKSCLFAPSPLYAPTIGRKYHARSGSGGLSDLIHVSPEVRDAIATNRPVVALESTIYTHGALGKDLPSILDSVVREHGAVPATIGVLDGMPKVGLSPEEIGRMVEEGARKISRRDFAHIVGAGLNGHKLHGGTTIAGTMILARAAGIRIFGTGGLGGVHRGGEDSMDISADLTELGRTRVAVISSGPKGFLDIPRTLEYLETQGVLVATFADGREGDVDLPAFWARESGTKSPFVVRDERQAAAAILAQEKLGIESGLVFANPIPKEHEIPREVMDQIINTAVREAAEQGFSGNANTPYILRRIRELSEGRSAPANLHLVLSNVARAAKVAVELRSLESESEGRTKTGPNPSTKVQQETSSPSRADILVAGSVALDLNCNFHNDRHEDPKPLTPVLHTSNPAGITQSIGGVGHNVALAAQSIHRSLKVKLCSIIGSDIAGATILTSMEKNGLDTSYIRQLGPEYPSARTAQYVAVNDAEKNLMLAMADMAILTSHSFPTYWTSIIQATKPKWLVVDGNWTPKDIHNWIKTGGMNGAQIAFEPVSTIKAAGLFPKGHNLPLFPKVAVALATPNQYELGAMYHAAKENGYMDSMPWFEVIDAFGMHGGARDRFVRLASAEMTDAGIPVQSVQLLPYIPTILTKMGDKGALLTTILRPDDPRLLDPEHERYILTRAAPGHPHVGGIYMRMYPAIERVGTPVSVNGMGDTFLGTLVAGLALGGRTEDLVDVAQNAAVMTLKSHLSVSPDLGALGRKLLAACGRAEQ